MSVSQAEDTGSNPVNAAKRRYVGVVTIPSAVMCGLFTTVQTQHPLARVAVFYLYGAVVEMADAQDLKSCDRKVV